MPTYAISTFQQTVGAGLGTWTLTVSTAGIHSVSVFTTEIPPSGVIVTINKNGTPVDTTSSPSPAQSVINANALIACVAGDTITVVLSSSNSSDTRLTMVKSVIDVHRGI